MKPRIVIAQAMTLVSKAFEGKFRTGPQRIPSATHSIRVGLHAVAASRPMTAVAAAFAHDLLKDTTTSPELIVSTFRDIGEQVLRLVQACTLKPDLGDTSEGEDELFWRVHTLAEQGNKEPLWIKSVDSYDNLQTNHQLQVESQMPALARGQRWLESLQRHLPNEKLLIGQLALVIQIQGDHRRSLQS